MYQGRLQQVQDQMKPAFDTDKSVLKRLYHSKQVRTEWESNYGIINVKCMIVSVLGQAITSPGPAEAGLWYRQECSEETVPFKAGKNSFGIVNC